MENAGRATAKEVRDDEESVTVFAGRGGNGGDALVAARLLQRRDVTVYLLGGTRFSQPDAEKNWDTLQQCSVETRVINDSTELPETLEADAAIDGMLGIGVKGEPREPVRSAIHLINAANARTVSIDVPTGLDPDTGEGNGVDADTVLSLHAPKKGAPGKTVDIGMPSKAWTHAGPGDLDLAIRRRNPDAHKGQHGKIGVVGGGPYTGAPALSALAALRTGADLVHIYTPETAADAVASYSPDLIVHDLPGETLSPENVEAALKGIDDLDACVVGPGLGQAEETRDAVETLIAGTDTPLVIDADAIQPHPDLPENSVLTPPRDEFRRLTDAEPSKENVENVAEELGATVLLKAPTDVISDGNLTKLNDTGNPRMAVGGTGDVLTGITAALLAHTDGFRAATTATFLNGRTGDRALEELGNFTATDLLRHIET